MRRVCIIGSSHVSAFKEGADALTAAGELDDTEITIFGSHRNSLAACRVRDGVVSADSAFVRNNFQWTSGGLQEIVIADYDEILVVAGFTFFSTQVFWAGAPETSLYDLPPISSGLAADMLNDLAERWDIRLAREIAQATSPARVIHLGIPLRSDAEPHSRLVLQKLTEAGSALPERLAFVRACIADRAAVLATETFRFAGPPEALLEEHGLFTRHDYCRGSKRLTANMETEHPEDDFGHMNARYGAALIQHLL